MATNTTTRTAPNTHKNAHGYCLIKRSCDTSTSDHGWSVVRVANGGQDVRSVMPGDMPAGGGEWTSRNSPKGVSYVASWYSYSYARRIFQQKTEEADSLSW